GGGGGPRGRGGGWPARWASGGARRSAKVIHRLDLETSYHNWTVYHRGHDLSSSRPASGVGERWKQGARRGLIPGLPGCREGGGRAFGSVHVRARSAVRGVAGEGCAGGAAHPLPEPDGDVVLRRGGPLMIRGRGQGREQGAAAQAGPLVLLAGGLPADQRLAAGAADLAGEPADVLAVQHDGDHGDAVWRGGGPDVKARGPQGPAPVLPPGIEPAG